MPDGDWEETCLVPRVARRNIFVPKIAIFVFLESLENENCGSFRGHLVYLFYGHYIGIVYGQLVYLPNAHLEYFFLFWYVVPIKIWQPCMCSGASPTIVSYVHRQRNEKSHRHE
jgi:hypothetical protein